jgi:hypothetical protein
LLLARSGILDVLAPMTEGLFENDVVVVKALEKGG